MAARGGLLTRKDLDASEGCTCETCVANQTDGFYMMANCHRGAQLTVFYNKHTGELELECGECRRPIARLPVSYGLS